jgi:hypothetical protein
LAGVIVVRVRSLFDDFSVQQMERSLNAMKRNTMRMVTTMPMKYGVESCKLARIGSTGSVEGGKSGS